MRTVAARIASATALLLVLAACGGNSSNDSGSTRILPTATTSQQAQALSAAQALVANCLAKEHTKDKIIACLAPEDQQEAFKTCALTAFSKAHVTTREGRHQLYTVDWPNCIVQAQKSGSATPTPKKTP